MSSLPVRQYLKPFHPADAAHRVGQRRSVPVHESIHVTRLVHDEPLGHLSPVHLVHAVNVAEPVERHVATAPVDTGEVKSTDLKLQSERVLCPLDAGHRPTKCTVGRQGLRQFADHQQGLTERPALAVFDEVKQTSIHIFLWRTVEDASQYLIHGLLHSLGHTRLLEFESLIVVLRLIEVRAVGPRRLAGVPVLGLENHGATPLLKLDLDGSHGLIDGFAQDHALLGRRHLAENRIGVTVAHGVTTVIAFVTQAEERLPRRVRDSGRNIGVIHAELGITADADTDNAMEFVRFSMTDGYVRTLSIAPEGKFPVRRGDSENPELYLDAWSKLPVGVDRKAPLADLYPAEVVSSIAAGLETASRWGVREGQLALASKIINTKVLNRLVREFIDEERSATATVQLMNQELAKVN